MNADKTKDEDDPKGVDLVQMEEDMENSRMDRLGRTLDRVLAEKQAKAAQATNNPPPQSAPPRSQDSE